jgi:hypothetical protein
LGGDRPSQTAHLPLSLYLLQGLRLEFLHKKGGISLVTPLRLTPLLQSLPPMLHKICKNPIIGCSKGSRGLSVLPRVRGIFTTTTISPSLSLRQCPSRYAIRAGRNLPDKEFRYLRTLIVRAAVHRGFSRKLLPEGITSSFNLPAPGRRQSVYIVSST